MALQAAPSHLDRPPFHGICPPIEGNKPALNQRKPALAAGVIINFPPRPDSGVLSKSIPLFFIARNRVGLWIAHMAEGRTGGIFLFKKSALRFAERNSAPIGCIAILFFAVSP
jgi:hypothetical protein